MLTGPRPSVLLYDWDNTLVDGWAGIAAALNAAFKEFGHPLWSVEDTRNRVRVSLRESFPVMFGERWEHARDVFYASLTRQHLDHVTAMLGVPDVLETGAAWPQGVVSNKAGAFLRREVTHLGWTRFFGSVIGPVTRPPISLTPRRCISRWRSLGAPPTRPSGIWATRPWTCRPLGRLASPRC